MIPDDIRNSITNWAKKRDRKNSDTLIILSIAFIEDNRIDWNTPTGKAKVISYINEFYYGETIQHHTLYDDGIAQKSNKNPFELSLDEIFPPDSADDSESAFSPPEVNKIEPLVSNPKGPESDTISYTNKIDTLPFPIEIKEILQELEDKAYKSYILTNLDTHGRLKLIRKAKIMIFLRNQAGIR